MKYLFQNTADENIEESEINENCHSEERKYSVPISSNIQSANYKFQSILNEKLVQSTVIQSSHFEKKENANYSTENTLFFCNCSKDPLIPCCVRAKNWMELVLGETFSCAKYNTMKDQYISIKNNLLQEGKEIINDRSYLQIKRDLARTYPLNKILTSKDFQTKLQNVLYLYSKYDPQISYVQGMNFIVASLLIHCSEAICFWLFVSILEDLDVRDVFQEGLPGLYKHTQILDVLLFDKLPSIYSHLCNNRIKIEMIVINWIFTLFTSLLPLDKTYLIWENFFKNSWIFVYKFVIAILSKYEKEILSTSDISDMIDPIKKGSSSKVLLKIISTVPFLNKIIIATNWSEIIKLSTKVEINEDHIKKMIKSYDSNTMEFKM